MSSLDNPMPSLPWTSPTQSGGTTVAEPKYPLSAYNMFFQIERKRILNETDSLELPITLNDIQAIRIEHKMKEKVRRLHRKSHGKIGFCDLARTVSRRWKVIDKATRKPLEQQAVVEKQEYASLHKLWKNSQKQKEKDEESIGQQQGRKLTEGSTRLGVVTPPIDVHVGSFNSFQQVDHQHLPNNEQSFPIRFQEREKQQRGVVTDNYSNECYHDDEKALDELDCHHIAMFHLQSSVASNSTSLLNLKSYHQDKVNADSSQGANSRRFGPQQNDSNRLPLLPLRQPHTGWIASGALQASCVCPRQQRAQTKSMSPPSQFSFNSSLLHERLPQQNKFSSGASSAFSSPAAMPSLSTGAIKETTVPTTISNAPTPLPTGFAINDPESWLLEPFSVVSGTSSATTTNTPTTTEMAEDLVVVGDRGMMCRIHPSLWMLEDLCTLMDPEDMEKLFTE
ncbi:hypothetical protein ACA910_016714 [Epithemia clementina (nom. ined.)]